MMDI